MNHKAKQSTPAAGRLDGPVDERMSALGTAVTAVFALSPAGAGAWTGLPPLCGTNVR